MFALFFLILVLVLTILYACGISVSGFFHDEINPQQILLPPSAEHWFGTDPLGRDLFTRVIQGAQMSLAIAFATGFNAWLIGSFLGIIAGYCGKFWDELIIRLIDFIYSLPDLLVLSLIGLFIGPSTSGIVVGLAFLSWMDVARLTRVEIAKLKNEEYAEASRAIGLSHWQIIFKHLYPNVLPSLIVSLSFIISRAILAESTLSFIGLGLSPPDTSWGTLASDAWQYLYSEPYLLFFPALMIFLTVFAFNFLGDKFKN